MPAMHCGMQGAGGFLSSRPWRLNRAASAPSGRNSLQVSGLGLHHGNSSASHPPWTPRPRQQLQQQQAGLPPAAVSHAQEDSSTSSSVARPGKADEPLPTQPPGSVPAALAHCASAPELLHVLEEHCQRGTDNEELALGALQVASMRRRDPHFFGSEAELNALLLGLERVLRRNLVAFTPKQLGLATRLYVVLGGSSQAVLGALQQEACCWAAEDYSLRPLSELAWSLAWIKRTPAPAFTTHLGEIVREPHRDWAEWFEGAKAGRLVMLLWGLASLGCQPSETFLEAACRRIQQTPLLGLSAKSLATLLWALARLDASDQLAIEALSMEVCARLELQLNEGTAAAAAAAAAGAGPTAGTAAGAAGAAAPAAVGSGQWHAERRWQQQQQQAGEGAAAAGSSGGRWAGGRHVSGQGAGQGVAEGAWDRWSQNQSLDDYGSPGWVGASDARLATGIEEEPLSWDASHSSSDGSSSSNGSRGSGNEEQGGEDSRSLDSASSTDVAARWDTDWTAGTASTLVWAWGKLRYRSGPGLRMATLLLYGSAEQLSSVDITRVLWGLAQLEYSQTQLLGALCSRLAQRGELASFSTSQLATVTYAFSAMDYFPGEPLLDLIADCCLAARERFDPRSLCHVLWSLARMGYLDEPFYLEFVPVVLADIQRYSPAELADLARVYAKFGLEPPGLFEAIAEQTVASMDEADIQDLLRILTAFNQLGLQPDSLLAAVEAWANQRLRQLSPQALTLALGTFARLGSPLSPSLLAAAAECVTQQLPQFEPAQLALVIWSFAKLGHPTPTILNHAMLLLVERTERFGDKAVSNVLWALATQRHPLQQGEEMLDRVALNLQVRLKGFGAQSLANIAWSCATLGYVPSPQFLKELGDAAKGLLPAFEPQGLAMLVWAFASMGYRHDALLASIDAFCTAGGRLRGFEGQHLSNLLWGMAKVGFCPGPGFWKQYAHEASLLVADLSSQELFNIGWAYATLRLHPRRLMAALAAEAARRPFALSTQELSGLLWALARLRHVSAGGTALAAATEKELERRAEQFEDRHLSTIVWAWGELGHRPGPGAGVAVQEQLARRAGGLAPQTLCMLAKGLAATHLQPSAPVAAALAARATQLLPDMKCFERAELLHSWLTLGLREEAGQLLQHLARSPSSSEGGSSPNGRSSSEGRSGGLPNARGGTAAVGTVQRVALGAGDGAAAGGGSAAAATAGDPPAAARQEQQGGAAAAAAGAAAAAAGSEPSSRAGAEAAAAAGQALLERPRPPIPRPPRPSSPFSLLDEVVTSGPLPSVIYLLAAMAELGQYPEPAFTQVCKRLRAASPSYRFSPRDLARLANAVTLADEDHRRRIVLKRGLQGRAAAAAAALSGARRRAGAAGHADGPQQGSTAQGGVKSWDEGGARPHRHDWYPPGSEEAA